MIKSQIGAAKRCRVSVIRFVFSGGQTGQAVSNHISNSNLLRRQGTHGK
jgi:hypothetical protein